MDELWRNLDRSVNYTEYINSQEWRRRRRAYLKKYALCNRCGMDNDEHRRVYGTALHVHHVSYARLGAELDEDLEALCHRKRAGAGPVRTIRPRPARAARGQGKRRRRRGAVGREAKAESAVQGAVEI